MRLTSRQRDILIAIRDLKCHKATETDFWHLGRKGAIRIKHEIGEIDCSCQAYSSIEMTEDGRAAIPPRKAFPDIHTRESTP